MPEDDFNLKQRNHADKIRNERELMDVFGKTRSQIRALGDGDLSRGVANFHNRRVLRDGKIFQGPKVQNVEDKLQPNKIAPEQPAQGGVVAESPASAVFVCNVNGQLRRFKAKGEFIAT